MMTDNGLRGLLAGTVAIASWALGELACEPFRPAMEREATYLPTGIGTPAEHEQAPSPSPSALPTYEFSEDEWTTKSQVRSILCDTRSGIEDAKQLSELQQLLHAVNLSNARSKTKGSSARTIANRDLERLDVQCGANPRFVANEVSFSPDVVLLSYARAGTNQISDTAALVRVGAVSFRTGQLVLATLWVDPRGPTLREGFVLATNVSRYFAASPTPCVRVECAHVFDYSTLYGSWELYFVDGAQIRDTGIAVTLPEGNLSAVGFAIQRFVAPAGARWQPSRNNQRPSAELIAEGIRASKESRFARAWGFFAEANRISPNPTARLNIARSLGAMGKREDACQRLQALGKEPARKAVLAGADLTQRVLECRGRRPTVAILAEVPGDATAAALLRAAYFQAVRALSIEPVAKKEVYSRADAILPGIEAGGDAASPLLATLRSELGVDLLVWVHQSTAAAASLRSAVVTAMGVTPFESNVSQAERRAKTDIEKALRVWKKEGLQPLE